MVLTPPSKHYQSGRSRLWPHDGLSMKVNPTQAFSLHARLTILSRICSCPVPGIERSAEASTIDLSQAYSRCDMWECYREPSDRHSLRSVMCSVVRILNLPSPCMQIFVRQQTLYDSVKLDQQHFARRHHTKFLVQTAAEASYSR